jgi:AraC-like DNA-binding protein
MWLMFDGPAAAGYLGLGYITPAPDPLAIKDVGPMRRGFSRLAEICRRHGPQLDVEAAISTHQLILAAQLAATDVGKPDEPVLSALRKGAALPLSVQAHAERLGISVSALRDTVRRSAGRGPREYIVQTRLNNAKNLLATSNLSVAAIARRVGYDDPAYFTRLFTHRVGSSPTQFRNQQQRLTTGIDDR